MGQFQHVANDRSVGRGTPVVIEIVLDGPPRGKERVRTARAGNKYTPERTVSWESRMALQAQTVMADRPLLEGPLHVEMALFMAVPASKSKKWRAAALSGEIAPTVKPDVDNAAKLMDALNMVVWIDDAQVVRLLVEKVYSDRPRTVIRVQPKPQGVFA